jgi:hypothetical protein
MTADTYGHLFPRGDDGAELAAAERVPTRLISRLYHARFEAHQQRSRTSPRVAALAADGLADLAAIVPRDVLLGFDRRKSIARPAPGAPPY